MDMYQRTHLLAQDYKQKSTVTDAS